MTHRPVHAAACTDVPTPVYTCTQQKAFGACTQSYMTSGGYCNQTCGRCSAAVPSLVRGQTPVATPAPTATPTAARTPAPTAAPTASAAQLAAAAAAVSTSILVNVNFATGAESGQSTLCGEVPRSALILCCYSLLALTIAHLGSDHVSSTLTCEPTPHRVGMQEHLQEA